MILLAQSDGLNPALLAAMAVAVVVVLLGTNWLFRRPPSEAGSRSHLREAPRQRQPSRDDATDDSARWEVAMRETARELSAQLDAKMGAIRAIVAEADRAAARLEAAIAQTRGDQQEANQAGSLRPPTTLGDAAPRSHRRDEIHALADRGHDAAEIARRVGSPIGEVKLILGLRGRP